MNDLVDNEKMVSTTEAAKLTGYSKDYVGQLCRQGKITCQRVSNSWYVDIESLKSYKDNGATSESDNKLKEDEDAKAKFGMKVGNVREDTFAYDGVEYIATSRAAELTGYAQDYVGQLARKGEVKARKVGRRWFVGRKSLVEHKKHADSMLAAVQAEASGVTSAKKKEDGTTLGVQNTSAPITIRKQDTIEPGNIHFNVRYVSETDEPLVPKMNSSKDSSGSQATYAYDDKARIPIHKVRGPIERSPVEYTRDTIRDTVNNAKNNTRLPVETRDSVVKTSSDSEITYQTVESQTKPTHFKLIIGLVLTVLLLATIGGAFWMFAVSGGIQLDNLGSFGKVLEHLLDTYGHWVPGNTFEYSVE